MTTAEQVRAARAFLGWSQGKLAAATGLSVQAVCAIERGKVLPRPTTMDRLTRALQGAGVEFIGRDTVKRTG